LTDRIFSWQPVGFAGPRSRRRLALPAALALAFTITLPTPGLGHVNPWIEKAPPAAPRRVGSLELRPCEDVVALCGKLERPLDPMGAVPGTVTIQVEFYPHTRRGKAQGTLVATEGGPGYPATQSRDEYLALFEPLRATRDVLIMDNRGTGRSGALDCRALQTGDHWTVELVARCGESLGERASLYSTTYAADDLAAILDALRVGKVDLYGDSYGTYFEQVFAVRHPDALRSIVLDGAYPLNGADYAWYPSYAPAMREKFNLACERSPGCRALPGSSIEHIEAALTELRAHPVPATAPDVDGRPREFRADATQLAIVMYGSAPTLTTARETDAAARAFAHGDRAPLLRLMAETVSAVDSRDPTADATKWSAGLAAAVMCQDPPQIVDMQLPPAERRLDRDRAVAERQRTHPDTYAPFTIDEYRAMPLDYSFLDQCVGWPVAPATHPASRVGLDAVYPDIPALVISGELDNITTLADGAAVAAAFKHGMQVRIANGFHVNALPHGRSACAAGIVQRFFATTSLGDTTCAAQVPPLRLVSRFAAHVSGLEPALAMPGNQANAEQLRMVAAAVLTAGDLVPRINYNSSGTGVGLRGGTFRITRTGDAAAEGGNDLARVSLNAVRWVEDVSVSGRIDRPPGRHGIVRASLVVTGSGPEGGRGRLRVRWPEGVDGATATIDGSFAAAKVAARMPAP
jgi:pimeloyl-ACP methyl ester carboxylesterase